jgi:hypothetical protein
MSRSYLLYLEFGEINFKEYKRLLKYLYNGFTRNQVWKASQGLDGSYFYCEMCCSGGINAEDGSKEIADDIIKKGFPLVNVKFWSLHPDNSVKVYEKEKL